MSDMSLENNIIGLLLLINRLQRTLHQLGRSNIVPFAALKLPEVARQYDRLVADLLRHHLVEGTAEDFSLTQEGEDLVRRVSGEYSLNTLFYNQYYRAVLQSKAHAEFCRRVYGKDLCQHGMADMAQIHKMLAELHPEQGLSCLDFGCGDGRIAEYISDTTGIVVNGVDIADEAIRLAQVRTQTKRDRLHFSCVDIEKDGGGFPLEPFDRIYAIDSIFFVKDQRFVLQVLFDHLVPGGRMAVFYICPPQMMAEETPLALSAKELEIPFSVFDLTRENNIHWTLKKQTLIDLEPAFLEEGSEFLFKNRLAECGGLDQFHRFLYVFHKQ